MGVSAKNLPMNASDVELALTHAPLVQVFADDPPGDPDVWLAGAVLSEFDESGGAREVCAATAYDQWPDSSRDIMVRPYAGDHAGGFALVPRTRHPKLLRGETTQSTGCGRRWPVGNDVSAPSFYEINREGLSVRLTYWFFYPTSSAPANDFVQMLPALLEARISGNVSDDLFPPICVVIPRNAIDRFWERVAARGGFGKQLVQSARVGGTLGTGMVVALRHALGPGAARLIKSLDPATQERIASLYVHEGDWEGITVELDGGGQPRRIAYWGHGHPIVADMTTAIGSGNRINVLVGRCSHASFPGTSQVSNSELKSVLAARYLEEILPGDNDATWDTRNDLRSVVDQPWYGFGGSWGTPRLAPFGLVTPRRVKSFDLWKEATGPLGPSRMKTESQVKALVELRH
jgi:hypothetical protein